MQLRQGRGCVREFSELLYYKTEESTVPGYLCVSSKAKSLKQLRPASTVQSGTERGHGVRGLTRPAHASLFERLPNNLFAGRFDNAAADGVTRLPEYVVRTLCFSHSLLLVYPLSPSQIIGIHPKRPPASHRSLPQASANAHPAPGSAPSVPPCRDNRG